jgi:hypothetical protein
LLNSQSDILPIEDFSGGLRTRGGIYHRKKSTTTTPNCNAVISSTGLSLEGLQGWTKITSGSTSGVGNGLKQFTTTQKTNTLLAHIGTSIYKMEDLDGTFDSILSTGVSNDRSEFDVFTKADGSKFILQTCHARNPIHYWDGITSQMQTITAAPQGKFLLIWKNYVWVTGHLGDQLRYSELNDFLTWPSSNTDDNFGTPDGDEHTGLAELRGRMIVLKENNIFRVSFLGGSPLFEITHVVSGTGCIASHTIRRGTLLHVNGLGDITTEEVLIFLTSDRRLVAFDGSNITNLSESIQDDNGLSTLSMRNLTQSALDKAHSVYSDHLHRYSIYLPTKYNTTPNYGLHFDTFTKGFWPESGQDFEASTDNVKNNAGEDIIVGFKDGHLYEIGRGSDYAGTAVNAFWTSEVLDKEKSFALKRGGHVEIHAKLSGQTAFDIQHRLEWVNAFSAVRTLSVVGGDRLGTTFVLGTSVLGGPRGNTLIYNFPYTFNGSQFKITANAGNVNPFTVYKIDFVSEDKGVGKSHA